jgi:hypothetical protein
MALYATVTDVAVENSEHGYHVVAETLGGNRWSHNYTTPIQAVAERLAARIRTAGEINVELYDVWVPLLPVYGSEAYQEMYAAAQTEDGYDYGDE